jgi:hypothetical protein
MMMMMMMMSVLKVLNHSPGMSQQIVELERKEIGSFNTIN